MFAETDPKTIITFHILSLGSFYTQRIVHDFGVFSIEFQVITLIYKKIFGCSLLKPIVKQKKFPKKFQYIKRVLHFLELLSRQTILCLTVCQQ